jgi:Tfp pilus assembly protein PilO
MKLILPISFIVITGILFFVIANPLYGEVKLLKTEATTYNLALDNSTELKNIRDSLVGTYKNITKEDKDRLDHFLPNTVGNIELILEIEKIANIHGLSIKNTKFDSLKSKTANSAQGGSNTVVVAEADPANNLPYGVFPIEFVIEGKYDSFLSFLNDLEHNLRLVDLKSVSFTIPSSTTPGDTTDPNIYSYTLKLETYWLK